MCNKNLYGSIENKSFEGSEKQANGRMPKLEFQLTDIDTGFYETTVITGEGIDKGDKAGYKAYTGALKYYFANTFMVATGDDPETESPSARMNRKVKTRPSKEDVRYILDNLDENSLRRAVEKYGNIEDMPLDAVEKTIMSINRKKGFIHEEN